MSDRVLIVLGTRPEAIKLAPVYRALLERDHFEVQLAVARQHDGLLDQALAALDLNPDFTLGLERNGTDLAALTGVLVQGLGELIARARPGQVIVQGDTTTAFCGALAGFYHQVPVSHVEAGLRTGDRYRPFPEELNRRMISVLSGLHFAPTKVAAETLLGEGVDARNVVVTGNTALDALAWAVAQPAPAWPANLEPASRYIDEGRFVLVTAHRRENWHGPIESVLRALDKLAGNFPDTAFIFVEHPNPLMRRLVAPFRGRRPNLFLIDPLGYVQFAHLLQACKMVLTDSGGLQEEAPMLDKPVLVLRERTERVEAEAAGTVRAIGTRTEHVMAQTSRLLTDVDAYRHMTRAVNPYGDGRAAQRIVDALATRRLSPAPSADGRPD